MAAWLLDWLDEGHGGEASCAHIGHSNVHHPSVLPQSSECARRHRRCAPKHEARGARRRRERVDRQQPLIGIKVGKPAQDQNVCPWVTGVPFHIHSHLCLGRRIIGERKQVHEEVSISRDTRKLSRVWRESHAMEGRNGTSVERQVGLDTGLQQANLLENIRWSHHAALTKKAVGAIL